MALFLAGSDPAALFFNELVATNSATATLQKRCATPIVAEVDRDAKSPPTAEIRDALGADENTPITYRSVRLKCGDTVYSRAENWYRPDLLTEEMNAQLAGDKPYGAVIASLKPTRKTLDVVRVDEADTIIRHRAIVLSGEGAPLALVIENYTPAALAPVI